MTWAAIIRAAALLGVSALFVTDYGLNAWAKEIDASVYLFLIAIALGVDAAWFREVIKAVLTRTVGLGAGDIEDRNP